MENRERLETDMGGWFMLDRWLVGKSLTVTRTFEQIPDRSESPDHVAI